VEEESVWDWSFGFPDIALITLRGAWQQLEVMIDILELCVYGH
jgi:hypothetical protein